jgi:hypothetical protein
MNVGAANAAVRSASGLSEPVIVTNGPVGALDQQYWADQLICDAYKASLALTARNERKRCREIVEAYAEVAPLNIRDALHNLIEQIDSR